MPGTGRSQQSRNRVSFDQRMWSTEVVLDPCFRRDAHGGIDRGGDVVRLGSWSLILRPGSDVEIGLYGPRISQPDQGHVEPLTIVSGKQISYDTTVHIGQTEIAARMAVGELFMIESQ